MEIDFGVDGIIITFEKEDSWEKEQFVRKEVERAFDIAELLMFKK